MKSINHPKKRIFAFLCKTHNIILTLVFTLVSCSNSDDTDDGFTPQTITPTLIGKGVLSSNSIYIQQNLVINTNEDWQELLTNFNSINDNITDGFTETNIDVTSFTILAVIDNKNSTTTVDVTSILENSTSIVVEVENLQNGISLDIAHPFHIVKIPKTTKTIIFE
jgi:hypothetical protein